ncbi:uncharacterized protein LOC117337758 [Pecten maximus]|uniref:uncharacterized protein LOC117337758 n=1 Tax=Pecten maximus TaxID=6579 RepID=UPI001458CCC3|nr:uncharacterized protein LOC117337758 [Pecten maximus]
MSDQGELYENSWILYRVLDRFIGNQGMEISISFQVKCVDRILQIFLVLLFVVDIDINGPASTILDDESNVGVDQDCVISFPCRSWPREANEWVRRLRLHDWPKETLLDEIVKGGCHLVPVGDKTSGDTFLQWRISFVIAERKLVHSLTHTQFLVYGLLKYFFKQTSGMLKIRLGDVDIISSYIIKTAIFYAVENTDLSIWQEKNIFLCFMLCLKILMTLVNAGYCPNYFINRNNMFLGKLHNENKGKLLGCLSELYNMTWNCLSVGTFIQPSIGERIYRVRNGDLEYVLPTPQQLERERDMKIFTKLFAILYYSDALPITLKLLSNSTSDLDEFVAYLSTAKVLQCTGMENFKKHISVRGNKEKYISLRKCKKFLTPLARTCTSPGLLTLATYHYQTGNYKKTLEMCEHMISSWKVYVSDCSTYKGKDRYERMYCGHGYNLLHKCQEACASFVSFDNNCIQFCPSQLHVELEGIDDPTIPLFIPPLPYAVFLSFLCYHKLGDTRRRDAELDHLRDVKYDEQGAGKHWIVHNLLGICFEIVGDIKMAMREYQESLRGKITVLFSQHPATKRIERLQQSQQK